MTIRMGARFVLVATLSCAAILALGGRADADAVEYCPAALAGDPQIVNGTDLQVQLESDGPRNVSGSLWIVTNSGWYQADFTAVPLAQNYVKTVESGISYTGPRYQSTTIEIAIPDPAGARAVFIVQAQATDDPSFGWDARGMVACDPPSDPGVVRASKPAAPSSITVKAQRIAAPSGFSTDCATPFEGVQQTSRPNLEFNPNDLGVRGNFATAVRVAVDERGNLAGAWTTVSSGYKAYDQAVVDLARRSTYAAARAFCAPVRGYYDFFLAMKSTE